MGVLPQLGDVLDGTYEIIEQIGQGGFGAVFRAKHLSMDRDVALKMLLTHGPKPEEMVERFKREVMAIRNLSHPNTVRIFDYRDAHDQSTLYYTMEYLKGITLKDLTRHEGAQSPRRVHHILRQVAKSLSEAHAYGIVHRDLKPANVMLVEMHGEVDFVKVLDFGIAKIMDAVEGEDEDDPLTSAGMLVGTLRYMSPEQITGAPLGPYTDIYALGLMAAELIAGQSVFAGTGRWEILQKQVSKDPIELPAELASSPLCRIMERMLAKDTRLRYTTTLELLKDLGALPESALSSLPLLTTSASGSPGTHNSNISNLHPHTPSSHSISSLSSVSQKVLVAVPHAQAPPMLPPHGMEDAPTMISPSESYEAPKTHFGFKTPHAPDVVHDSASDHVTLAAKSKTPLLIAAVVCGLLLTVGATVFVLSQASTDIAKAQVDATSVKLAAAPSLPQEELAALPSVTPGPEASPVVPAPEPKQFLLTLKTDGAKEAQVFDGEKQVGVFEANGSFTYIVEPDVSKSLHIKSKGYKDRTITLAYDQPLAAIDVTLERAKEAKVEEAKPSTAIKTSPRKEKQKTTSKEEVDDLLWDINN